jgi:hypothetical protein
MRYRGENLIENSVNEEYREGNRERRLEIASEHPAAGMMAVNATRNPPLRHGVWYKKFE